MIAILQSQDLATPSHQAHSVIWPSPMKLHLGLILSESHRLPKIAIGAVRFFGTPMVKAGPLPRLSQFLWGINQTSKEASIAMLSL